MIVPPSVSLRRRSFGRSLAVVACLVVGAMPDLGTAGMPANPSPTRGLQDAADGPDRARRADEDARIAAAEDQIVRAEARLDAAAAALRLDLPPRVRTRIWWTPVDADLAARAAEVAARATTLANATFTDLLASTHSAVDRLQARSAVIRAVATALADRVAAGGTDDWTTRLARLHTDAADAPERTSQLDGPTLLALAAAALAQPTPGVDAARSLHARAGTVPDGIDALEFGLLESLIEAGGLDPTRRREATATLLRTPRPAPDRLLLAAIHLDATLETGRPIDTAISETLRAMLPARGVDAEDRARVVRAFAEIAAAAVPTDAPTDGLPPIVALTRLAAIGAAADPTAMRSPETAALVSRATSDPSPDVQAEAWLEAAMIRMRCGDATAALDAMLQAIEASPRHPRAATAAGLAMRLAERLEDAAAVDAAIARLVSAQPDHPQRHRWSLMRGDRALDAGDLATARAAWTEIPRSADVGVEAALRVLRLDADRLNARNADRVITSLDDLEATIPEARPDPRRVEADLLRIRALAALERTTSAAEIAARFLDPSIVPESYHAEIALVALPALESAGRTDEADRLRAGLAAIDQALASRASGDRLRRSFDGVMAAIDRDDRPDARRLADESLSGATINVDTVLEDARTRPEAAVQAGWMLAASGRTADARRIADAVVKTHPGVIEGLFLQAVLQGGRLDAPDRTRPAPDAADAAAAVRSLSRINAGSGRGSAWWWRSEIEKLEILAALGRDLAKIDARLERLETEFSNLGGPAFERRARALRASLRSAMVRQ